MSNTYLAVIDSSQIECRILNYVAGQEDVTEKFRQGGDPYVGIASAFYGRPITTNDPDERGTGKQAELSCGYGCGGPKFKRTAALGIYGPSVSLSDIDAQRFVDLYRRTHPRVTGYWKEGESMLFAISVGQEMQWGPMLIRDRRIYLPNGAPLIYETLEYHVDGETGEVGWRLRTRQGWVKMYGAKLVENVIQALARVHTGQAMIRIARAGLRIVGMSHDELWILIPKSADAQSMFQFCLDTMKEAPKWLPGIPLGAEGSMGERYAK